MVEIRANCTVMLGQGSRPEVACRISASVRQGEGPSANLYRLGGQGRQPEIADVLLTPAALSDALGGCMPAAHKHSAAAVAPRTAVVIPSAQGVQEKLDGLDFHEPSVHRRGVVSGVFSEDRERARRTIAHSAPAAATMSVALFTTTVRGGAGVQGSMLAKRLK